MNDPTLHHPVSRRRARQVIGEVEGALQNWHTTGRFKDMGIPEQACPHAAACCAACWRAGA